ncbi:uncharacterized protein LOC110853024 [Folsomia candida]|uniref:uncharacterized protein LOC110853024 n=1 Tax=Folsomia candida TaxID=158441 RepID=UPI000B905520|nr:uncharacterized protein LOC110853024 [Folsomia candida]
MNNLSFLRVFCSVILILRVTPTACHSLYSPNKNTTLSSTDISGNSSHLVRELRQGKSEVRSQIPNPWEGARVKSLLNPPFRGLLPFIESGGCKSGWTYRILKGEELIHFGHELECIFFSGVTPSQVPKGPLYGTILSIFNMEQFSGMMNLAWWGKLVNQVDCPAPGFSQPRPVFIGWNNLLGQFIVPFIARIGPLEENLAPGEFYDGKINLVLDYTVSFPEVCSDFEWLKESQGSDIPEENMYPLNKVVDILRLVGRQADGGAIYLGKSYVRDSFDASSTVIYFYFVNYDMEVNPEFEPGQELPPLVRSFSYTIPGLNQMVI